MGKQFWTVNDIECGNEYQVMETIMENISDDIYDQYLDSEYNEINIEGLRFFPSEILKANTVDYTVSKDDWLDSEVGQYKETIQYMEHDDTICIHDVYITYTDEDEIDVHEDVAFWDIMADLQEAKANALV